VPYVQIVNPTHFLVVAVLTQHLGLGPGVFGFIVALPSLCAMLQSFASPGLTARLGARRTSLVLQALDLCVWVIALLSLPWLGNAGTGAATLFFLVIFMASQGVRAVNRVANPSWTCEWLPAKVRGSFFGNRNGWCTLVLIIFAIAVVPLLKKEDSWTVYQIFLALAVVMKAGSLLLQSKIRTPPARTRAELGPQMPGLAAPGSAKWRAFFNRGRPFIIFTALIGLVGVFRSIISPFRSLYLLQEVGFSAAVLAEFAVVELCVTAAAYPLWVWVGRRAGFTFVLRLTVFAFALEALAWALMPGTSVAGFAILRGVGALILAGFGLAMFTLQLNLIPKVNGATYLSLAVALEALCGSVSPIVFGMILNETDRSAAIYKTAFLIASAGLAFAATLFWRHSRNNRIPLP